MIDGVEILNPKVDEDRRVLTEALSEATEVVTSLPAVDLYETGGQNSTAGLLAQGLRSTRADGTIVYTRSQIASDPKVRSEYNKKLLAREPVELVEG